MSTIKILSYYICLIIVLAKQQHAQRTINCDQYKRPFKGDATFEQRQFINCFGKDVESGTAELVILLDTSGSMTSVGSYNGNRLSGFEISKKFIKALLSEVRIAFNATRIAIGTFSTESKIKINYILNPSYANHKCKFVKEFKGIGLDGGLTNLRGALNDAYDIFRFLGSEPLKHSRRDRSNKVVLLLSDGYGNVYNGRTGTAGANAEEEARRLRQTGFIEVYTVSVTDGADRNMLRKIATHDSLALYSKDFDDLSALVWNIRGDPYERDYETHDVDTSNCVNCDRDAVCGCNLRSGNYRCVCQRGWYGTGEFNPNKRNCFECKKGTYGDKRGYVTGCKQCPPNSETKYIPGRPAKSIKDCFCKKGYKGNPGFGIPCKPNPCVPAPDINFAIIQNPGACQESSYLTKCYYQCKKRYKMISSRNYIVCQDGAKWDRPLPQCQLITCNAPWIGKANSHRAIAQCSALINPADNSYPSETRCTFSCKSKYFQSKGNTEIKCLDSGKWNAEHLECGVASCAKIPRLDSKIQVQNPEFNCFEKTLNVGDRCEFWCPSGYELRGLRRVLECNPGNKAIGYWNIDIKKKANLPSCHDVEAPKFAESNRCDLGIFIDQETEPGKNYAAINFEMINVTDNSGEEVEVTCVNGNNFCPFELGKTYNIKYNATETQVIHFNAKDQAGNIKGCRFELSIKDKEPPKIVECPDNIRNKTTSQQEKIFWKEPIFEDNCGSYEECNVRIKSNIANGANFFVGIPTTVRYTAIDPSNNINDECTFTVSLEALTCNPIDPPINGLIVRFGSLFQAKCKAGSYPGENTAPFYLCQNGKWRAATVGVYPIPDCIKKDPPDGMDQFTLMQIQYEGNCNDPAVQESVRQGFKGMLCPECEIKEIEIFCGSGSLVNRRKRSAINQISLRASIITKVSKDQVRKDPKKVLEDLKKKMDSIITPQYLSLLRSTRDWKVIQKYIRSLDSIRTDGPSKETCTDVGDEHNSNEADLTKKCVVCGVGKFKNLLTGKCEKCPPGMYQPKSGQTSCLKCPQGSVIIGNDTKHFSSCREICKPGEYSANGLQPCSLCPAGSYADKSQAIKCTKCPIGSTTVVAGSKSVYECGSQCLPGTFSPNGVEPCQPCPRGKYQPKHGRDTCIDCPNLLSTAGLGTISKRSCIDINDCSSNPCLNNAHCVDLKDNYKCECKDGFWGKNCEKEVDDCSLKPCANNGTCIDKFKGYTCKCPIGTAGENCNEIVTKCDSVYCGSHGKCVNLANFKFQCVCDDFYTGEFCETKIDPCHSNPCSNNGYCIPKLNDFTCVCQKGYDGLTCEKKFNYCSSHPCKNGGTCTDQSEGFACRCPIGYSGLTCTTRINMCEHIKCHNGGECETVDGRSACKCAAGYGGEQCDIKESNGFDYLFQTRVSPSYVSVHGRMNLRVFTLTFWMRTSDLENVGTPLSYAVNYNGKIDDNALTISDYSNFNLVINNKTQPLELGCNDGFWHHVAITWQSSTGSWKAYKDGVLVTSSKKPFQRGAFIPKGGLFVIGEEQDELGGGFTPEESFFGDISQMNMWNRELSINEIKNLIYSCGHMEGNVFAWSDFRFNKTGQLIVTEPSVACSERNNLREFQMLKDHTLPISLKKSKSFVYVATSSSACAQKCLLKLDWCRSFTFEKYKQKCRLYSTSDIIDKMDPVVMHGTDLYSYTCVSPLGMSSRVIQDKFITASSSRNRAYSHLARLFNVPKTNELEAYWQPTDYDRKPFLQIDLQKMTKILGIATQGHYEKNVNEFATSISIAYLNKYRKWIRIGPFKANSRSVEVKRIPLNIEASIIQIFPIKDSSSRRIALRVELYGCLSASKSLSGGRTYCQAGTCMNGGRCYNLLTGYKCVCLKGFVGNRCQNYDQCGINDLDIPLNNRIISSTNSAVKVSCKPGFKGQEQTLHCVKGQWERINLINCQDIDECASKSVCSDTCENSIGSYRCTCPVGKVKSSSNPNQCIDVNECSSHKHFCQNACINTNGGFKCTCAKGYHTPFQRNCYDINECETGQHNCEQLCDNRLGSFKCSCRPGYKLASDQQSCIFVRCPRLSHIAMGSVRIEGKKAIYSCRQGYKVNGGDTRICQADGTWTGERPSCKGVRCEILYAPENGRISFNTGNAYGGVIKFVCNHGYRMIGASQRTCGQDSKWSSMQPRCIVEVCPSLSVQNGAIVGLGRTVGSAIRIQCNKGYKLKETNLLFRTCQSNGQWTGGNNARITCQVIDCGSVPSLSYGQMTYKGGTHYNGMVIYQCKAGRCLNGESSRRCQSNGQWSGKPPTCQANSCCRPPVPRHAELFSNGRFTYGDPAFIKCDTGYKRGGDDFRECGRNGAWSGTDTTCTIVDCGHPGSFANGFIYNMEKTTYKTTIGYFCNPGYYVGGNLHRTCQANGKWSGTQPKCIKDKYGGHIRGKSGNVRCHGTLVCHFLFEVSQGKQVTIHFSTFNIGDNDKVEIYEKDNYTPFVVFTKAKQPKPITSNNHFIRVITNGFVSIDYKESACGGLLGEKHGAIISPNYPNNYPPNLDCYWTIHRPYDRLELKFLDFQLQLRNVDFVTVTEGPFKDAEIFLFEYYRDVVPELTKEWSEKWYWIHFRTDGRYQRKGFKAFYKIYRPRDFFSLQ